MRGRRMRDFTDAMATSGAIEFAPGIYWIGALDPALCSFDIIPNTANRITCNAYLPHGSEGTGVVDAVRQEASASPICRQESVADYDEIKGIVLNHSEPDHCGVLPEPMHRARRAKRGLCKLAASMLKAVLKSEGQGPASTTVTASERIGLEARTPGFLHTPLLHWLYTSLCHPQEPAWAGCHAYGRRIAPELMGRSDACKVLQMSDIA